MGAFRRRAVATLAALALSAALAGCAHDVVTSGGPGVAAPPPPDDAASLDQALAAWKDFPADQHPRPVVLIGPVAVRPAGYTTGEAKEAAVAGLYRVDVPLPPDPPPATVSLPDGPARLPVIGAAAAVALMKADAGDNKAGGSVAPLAITGFEFGTESLSTDRGMLPLPVWRVHTADELGPTVVIALPDSALARPAATQSTSVGTAGPAGARATVDATGTHLTLTVSEADPHCPGEAIYKREPVVKESGSAVAVGFTATQTGTVPGSGMCAMYLKLKPVTYKVDLAAPLGARVVLTAQGEPVPVASG